jgi:teichuronic acid biosynthesis glycosyltransferase TuaC
MNILAVSSVYPRPGDPSFGIFVHRSVKYLQKLGHHIIVISPVPWSPNILRMNPRWRNYSLTPEQVVWEGIEVYYTRYLRLPGAWFRSIAGFTNYQGMASLVLKLHHAHNFDIIHSNMLFPDGLAGVYLGRKLNLPTVCTTHGIDAVEHPRENALNLHCSKIVIRHSSQMVAVSRALEGVIEDIERPLRPVRVVYNGVDLDEFQTPEATAAERGQLKMASMRPYILFVGRNVYVKGLKDLLTAFAQLLHMIEHNLVVIGPPLSEVRQLDPELTNLLGDRLIVLGCLSPHEVPAYMQASEVFVLPSYVEGLPMVVLEAMACGRPVIGTDVMGIPEAVIHGVTGWVVRPGDPAGLAESIRLLVSDPARCREMGRRGRERIVQEFTWERHALELSSVYEETVKNTGSPALLRGNLC